MKHILLCPACMQWTMHETHSCSTTSLSTKPPKYSPEDKYGEYRRQTKKESWKSRGLA